MCGQGSANLVHCLNSKVGSTTVAGSLDEIVLTRLKVFLSLTEICLNSEKLKSGPASRLNCSGINELALAAYEIILGIEIPLPRYCL